MVKQPDYIPSTFIEPMIRYLRSLDWREKSDVTDSLTGELLSIRGVPSLGAAEYCELLDRVQSVDDSVALGLKLGLMAEPRDFGIVGYLVLSCGNVGQALGRYRRFQQLLQGGLRSWVETEGSVLRIHWSQQSANTPIALEYSAGVFISLCRALVGRQFSPSRVGLPFDKPDISDGVNGCLYDTVVGCPVVFSCPSLFIEVPARMMAMRIATSDPHLRQLLETQASAMLQSPDSSTDDFGEFFDALQTHIVSSMKDGELSAEAVAKGMGIPLRSFYRRLSENGHSFRSVLADIRLRLAKQYLADPNLSQSDVSFLLGYSEQSSFIRAFKVWTSVTPGDYRATIQAKK
ncbi:AraC family transcriptional regulator [Aurantivibrio plasticivorans]